MSSPSQANEEPSSSGVLSNNGPSESGGGNTISKCPKPPAKRRLSSTVIEISDTESDDSDICAITSYQASADEVKRIRGVDYTSTTSTSEYSSDSDSSWEDDCIVLEDDELISMRAVKAHLYPRANRMEDPKLNTKLESQELIARLTSNWRECMAMSTEEVTLTTEPFRLCLLHNFLSNPDIINNIVDDMNTLDWTRKKMDLYEFHQTADLASLTWQRSIRGIYELLKTDVMTWVSKVTGLELTGVSASCSLYGPGDHLLVHDDLLGDRRVAFILYLAPWQPDAPSTPPLENGGDKHVSQVNPGWRPHMGGALELLGQDAQGPTEVVHAVYPENNMLAFFQVGSESFHQVSEVLSMELPRLSINGWFRGVSPPPLPDHGDQPLPPPTERFKPHNETVVLSSWVASAWLSPRARAQVQAQVERDSEVCLRGLLPPPAHRALLAALAQPGLPWRRAGPPNQRRHDVLEGGWDAGGGGGGGGGEPECAARGLLRLASSAAFCRFLSDCTDLAPASYGGLQLQRWRAGDFTLLPPRETYQAPRLEVVLYLGVPPRALCGGATVYVAPEEAEAGAGAGGGGAALVTVPPEDNALSLVYCDAGAASFTKYVSRLTLPPHACFYVLTCSYSE